MSQDKLQEDTSQESGAQEQYSSLEEAVFGVDGSSSAVSSAFTTGNEAQPESAPQGQPETEISKEPSTQQNNDETRYQYWQSQADKYKNELESVKQQQSQVNTPAPVESNTSAENPEEFPLPPSKPAAPRTFSREEAYADPSSESARYLDEVESWRDDMSEYNSLRSQYQTAIIEERFNKMEQEKVEAAKRFEAQQRVEQQQAEVKNLVMGHYGMNENEAKDFMETMADPKSVNIDNLVQLYRMRNSNPAVPTAPATPSPEFQQTRNAQQVPSPMGVMPSGQSGADTRNVEDKIMDTMIGNFNAKNPWK